MSLWPFSRKQKRFGYKKDRRDARDQRMGWARPGALYQASSLRRYVREVFDQGHTNTCVAQSAIMALAIRLVIRGQGWMLYSRLFPYWFGRTLRQRFTDGGCFPRELLKALASVGSPLEKKWPFDPRRVQQRPPPSLHREAVDLTFRYERCIDNETTAEALLQGCPVVFGMPVDEEFVKDEGPHVITKVGKPIGNHMMTVVGNDPERRAFLVLNSYGIGYRDLGYVWISWDVMAEKAMDRWAIR